MAPSSKSSRENVQPADVRAQLGRILGSRHLAKAPRLSRFLAYVVEQSLSGEDERLKESVIGLEVFDRPPTSYDPSVDPIVRVQASRLRTRLTQYYEDEGEDDPIVIDIPLGGYAARVRPRAITSSSRETLPKRESVMVLPFVNMSPDADDEYFSDGLTEELTHFLVQLGSLQLVARTSAFQFKSKARDVREIGRQMGVSKVLEGSVRRAGERLRITVQLVNVEDGCQVWSQRYERSSKDIFAIQDEISAAVGRALTDRTLDVRRGPTADVRVENVEAFNHYLHGRYQWNKRTETGFQAAIEHFLEAVRLDPNLARAYSGLADCHLMLGMSAARAPGEAMPEAEQAAIRALEIDGELAEARTSLGAIMATFRWNQHGAKREFRGALRFDSGYATLHHWLAFFHCVPRAKGKEAMEQMQRAAQLDPISLPIQADIALLHLFREEEQKAIEQCRRVIGMDQHYHRAHWFMGLALERQGNFEAAMSALERALDDCPGAAFRQRILSAMGLTLARWGKRAKAEELRGRLSSTDAPYVDQFELAQLEMGFAATEQALDYLERAVEERSSFLVFAGRWPSFRELRREARFRTLLDRCSVRT